MQFKNLTPFDALAYSGMDTQDREYHVLAMAVGYRLLRDEGGAWRAELIEDEPLPLCRADEHWGDPASSSLARESDLVPYKPRCDVLVRGHSHAPGGLPARQWTARLRLTAAGHGGAPAEPQPPRPLNPLMGLTASQREAWERELDAHRRRHNAQAQRQPRSLLDKRLQIHGPSDYRHLPLLGWLHGNTESASRVPLRWEHSFGGSCRAASPVPAPPEGQDPPPVLMSEVCFANPVGCGWLHRGWRAALRKAGQPRPSHLSAPQILSEREAVPSRPLEVQHPKGEQDARRMAEIAARYGRRPAGFAPLGKAWAPRLALAGRYDQAWLDQRHPLLPKDFDFGFWNGAPEDQQIPFPDLSEGYVLHTEGLLPGGGAMSVSLPAHRGFALMRLDDGLVLPLPMQVDLIELDTDAPGGPQLRLVWRTAVLQSMGLRVLEARFEMDPQAPLFTLAPSADYQKPSPADLEAPHG